MATTTFLVPPTVEPLTGAEAIVGTGAVVSDFWAWAVSNLRENVVRSMLAEYLVALAVGARNATRVEWDAYDVLTPDDIRVEVKSSSSIQAWKQKSLSRIVFSGLSGRLLMADGRYSTEPSLNADVYVFAVLEATDHTDYHPLDTTHWSFWVLPAAHLRVLNQRSVSLATIRTLAGEPITFDNLSESIRSAAQQ